MNTKYKLMKLIPGVDHKVGHIFETSDQSGEIIGLKLFPGATNNSHISAITTALLVSTGFLEGVKDDTNTCLGLTAYYNHLEGEIVIFKDYRPTGFTVVEFTDGLFPHLKRVRIQSVNGSLAFVSNKYKIV